MHFSEQTVVVSESGINTPYTDGDLNKRIGPHLDHLIDYLAEAQPRDPRVHTPPKFLPHIVVYIGIGMLNCSVLHSPTLFRSAPVTS